MSRKGGTYTYKHIWNNICCFCHKYRWCKFCFWLKAFYSKVLHRDSVRVSTIYIIRNSISRWLTSQFEDFSSSWTFPASVVCWMLGNIIVTPNCRTLMQVTMKVYLFKGKIHTHWYDYRYMLLTTSYFQSFQHQQN